ncbi:DUF3343 domain-containing protein [Gorillibacterium sp. sgz500922]|uniref:DUF3343 domain-containing protein n=1 Tax=Gorillibacterium sp. sgz500922 TaxID=3446694 RepID=UPI003F66BDAC
MLLIAFDSTQQALRTEMLLDYAGVESDTQPTPKSITAGCALSIGFAEEELPKVAGLLRSEQVEIRGIFRFHTDGYVPVEW